MSEPAFLNDVALFIPEVQELLARWETIRDVIDALLAMFTDRFVDYPRYRIRDGGPFLYEKEWKVLPTTIIEGEALDATIQSPIGVGETDLKEAHARLLALVRANLPTLDRILAPAERARRCANGFISRMRPGATVNPHTGWVRDWLRVHIGLRTDPGAAITVGNETRSWTDGGILAFGDGGPWLHSVRHNGTRDRLILSTDFRISMLGSAFARACIDVRSTASSMDSQAPAATGSGSPMIPAAVPRQVASELPEKNRCDQQNSLFETVKNYPLLTADECQRVAATIQEMRSYWTQRDPVAPFFTLGVASYLDATQDSQRLYHAPAYQMNTVLAANFSWVYRRLLEGLTQLLGEKVVFRTSCALPGFHIALWRQAAENREASVHQDLQYQLLDWKPGEKPDFWRPMSFTLAITLPQHGGGLNVWDVNHEELEGLSPDERQRKIMAARMQYHPYQVGHLAVHSGHQLHQIARTKKELEGDERVTLQGHGIRCDGAWQLYW